MKEKVPTNVCNSGAAYPVGLYFEDAYIHDIPDASGCYNNNFHIKLQL